MRAAAAKLMLVVTPQPPVAERRAEKRGPPPFKPCSCEYRLQREANVAKVVGNCKETGGPASLAARECRARALEILSKEVNVDTLILSHFRETQYTVPAMELLQRLQRVVSELRQISLRNPYKTYFDGRKDLSAKEKKDQQKSCEECPWNPMTFFDGLAQKVVSLDAPEFYGTFVKDGERLLGAEKPEVCNPCLGASRGEMEYMSNELMGLRAFVLYEGFRVVEPEPVG